jgi:hypothetical protein
MANPVFRLPPPTLQIGFAHRLVALSQTHLQPALLATAATLDIAELDRQLASSAPPKALQKLAAVGLRGEALFATPLVLTARPSLLTYYRTVLGYSQKEFYKVGSGLTVYRRAEEGYALSAKAISTLPDLCDCLIAQAWKLLVGIDAVPLTARLLNELSLLSVGPQLRGGNNNARGESGIDQVFEVILSAVAHAKPVVSGRAISFVNASKRTIVIEVAADPDVVILERMASGVPGPLVAIEVKAGTDASNIHNRIGEAEKSHLKAKARKFTECWTIINVDTLDLEFAHAQSPTTNRFFKLSELLATGSENRQKFVESIISLVGIKAGPRIATKKSSKR